MSKNKLYIDVRKEYEEPKDIQFEKLGYFFDKKSRIGVIKIHLKCNLKVGTVYDFTYENDEDSYTYCYLVLKKEGYVYYIAEYYNGFYEMEEAKLGDVWEKCSVKEKLGIDLENYWKNMEIANDSQDTSEERHRNKYTLRIHWERNEYAPWDMVIIADDTKEYVTEVIKNYQKNNNVKFESPVELMDAVCDNYGWEWRDLEYFDIEVKF